MKNSNDKKARMLQSIATHPRGSAGKAESVQEARQRAGKPTLHHHAMAPPSTRNRKNVRGC